LYVFVKQECKATDVVDFQAAKEIGSTGVLTNSEYVVKLKLEEKDILYPVGAFGVVLANVTFSMPSFPELLKRGDEIRKVIVKCHDVLPSKRDPEYYSKRKLVSFSDKNLKELLKEYVY